MHYSTLYIFIHKEESLKWHEIFLKMDIQRYRRDSIIIAIYQNGYYPTHAISFSIWFENGPRAPAFRSQVRPRPNVNQKI